MDFNWVTFVILILNAAVSVLTNYDVNRKRNQVRSTDQ